MSFWRKQVIEPALEDDTNRLIAEQKAWIGREPGNALPYYHLAQLYRIRMRQDEALGLLLEAVRLDDVNAAAHVSLAEIYTVRDDPDAAWKHARKAEAAGDSSASEMLRRYGVKEK